MIFQSDIRRALAHFGQAPFFRYFYRQESANETIEELVVAATMLSQQRIGAIIAIERRSACGTTSRAASRSTPR